METTEIIAELRKVLAVGDSPVFCGGTFIPKQLAMEAADRLEELSQNKSGDLISREALTDVIESTDWYHVNSKGELVHGATSATGLYRFGDIMCALENAPAVEAEPVVHAHWEQYTDDDENWGDLSYFKCSACGTVELTGRKRCPECGAHMDEEVADV